MKRAVTFRLDAALLDQARGFALRTPTNHIEAMPKGHVAAQRGRLPESIARDVLMPPAF